MYKAITVFDLDNTLLDAQKKLPAENIAALNQLRVNNVLPVIGTGRDLFEIRYVANQGHFEGVISANGANVMYHNRQLQETMILMPTLEKLTGWAQQQHIAVAYSNTEAVAVNQMNATVRKDYSTINCRLPRVDALFYRMHHVNKMLLFIPVTQDDDAVLDLLRRQFPELDFFRNSPYCIDVAPKGVSKATGITSFARLLHLQSVPVFAFGDGNNDVEMLEKATTGVAMGNASVSVQQHANYVTSRFDDHGIQKALRHFDLI